MAPKIFLKLYITNKMTLANSHSSPPTPRPLPLPSPPPNSPLGLSLSFKLNIKSCEKETSTLVIEQTCYKKQSSVTIWKETG